MVPSEATNESTSREGQTGAPPPPPRDPAAASREPEPTPRHEFASSWRRCFRWWTSNHAALSSLAQIIYSGLTLLLVTVVVYQTYTLRGHYLLDREVARRELLRHLSGVIGEIYRDDELHVRQREYAVQEYLRAVRSHSGPRGREGQPGFDFQGCDDTGPRPQLSGAPLRNTVFRNDDLSCIDFSGADFSGAILVGCHLEGTILSGATLRFTVLRDAFLMGADFSGAELFGTDLAGANLRGANLRDARLAPPAAQRDEATGVAPDAVKLQSALLAGADFGGVSFCYLDLRGVDLSQAKNVRQEQLNGATVDATTRLPPGLRPPKQDQPCPML